MIDLDKVEMVEDLPKCVCPVIGQYALTLNDWMGDGERQRLLPYVVRLAGTRGDTDVERQRAELLAMRAVNVFAAKALRAIGLADAAARCKAAETLEDASRAANDAAALVITTAAARIARQAALAALAAACAVNDDMRCRAVHAARHAARAVAFAATRRGADAARLPVWDHAITALSDALAIDPQRRGAIASFAGGG